MKKNSLVITIFIISIILFSVLYSNFSKAQNNSVASVVVKNSVIKTVPSDSGFIGSNWFGSSNLDRYIFTSNNLNLLGKDVNSLDINTFRFPAGNLVSAEFWDVPNQDQLLALRKMPPIQRGWIGRDGLIPNDQMQFKDFISFSKGYNLKTTIQVNTHNYYDKANKQILPLKAYAQKPVPDRWSHGNGNRDFKVSKIDWNLVNQAADYAAAQVKWVKDNGYYNQVKYWELGNEDYSTTFLTASYSGDEYAKVASIFITKMKAVNPSIKIILTNFITIKSPTGYDYSRFNDWSKAVLIGLAPYKNSIYAVSNHIYHNTGADAQYEIFRQNITQNRYDSDEQILNLHKQLLNSLGYINTKIIINEFNGTNTGSPYCNTWIGAVGTAQMFMAFANHPSVDHADYLQLIYATLEQLYKPTGYTMIHFAKDSQTPFINHPIAYISKFFNENFRGSVLKSEFNSNQIYATSTLNNGTLKVILLNMDKTQPVSLDLSAFNNLKYIGNISLGTNIPPTLNVIQPGDSYSNSQNIKTLNQVANAIPVTASNKTYSIQMTPDTIAVFEFNVQ